jgi:hypothetical protein
MAIDLSDDWIYAGLCSSKLDFINFAWKLFCLYLIIVELRVVIVISQRHVSDLGPPAMRVAGVSVERVFSVAHKLGASFLKNRAPRFLKFYM